MVETSLKESVERELYDVAHESLEKLVEEWGKIYGKLCKRKIYFKWRHTIFKAYRRIGLIIELEFNDELLGKVLYYFRKRKGRRRKKND